MTVQVNGVINPSAETNTTGYTAVPGTTGAIAAGVTSSAATTAAGTKVARCTWTTASTAAGGGAYYEVLLSATPFVVGDTISAAVFHVLSSISNRLQMSVGFYNGTTLIGAATLGAQKQVNAATVYGSASAADPAFKVDAMVIPATTTKVRISVLSVPGTGYANWSVGSLLDLDMLQLVKASTVGAYIDGDLGPAYGWNGVIHASTSSFYTPSVTLTPLPDRSPVPRVKVALTDLYPTAQTVTVYRLAGDRTFRVRGGVALYAAGGVTLIDYEAPFQTVSSYSFEMFNAMGTSLGFSPAASTTLVFTGTCVHQPVDPTRAAFPELNAATAKSLARPFKGALGRAQGRTLPVWIGNGRGGLEGLSVVLEATSAVDTAIASIFGGYGDDQIPVVCLRTSLQVGLPAPLFLAAQSPAQSSVDGYLGSGITLWDISGDEASPPAEAIITALLSYADIEASFSLYSQLEAAYLTYLPMESDYSLSGVA